MLKLFNAPLVPAPFSPADRLAHQPPEKHILMAATNGGSDELAHALYRWRSPN